MRIVTLCVALDIDRPRNSRGCLGPKWVENLAPRAGFEPATNRLTAGCSTTELPGNTEAPAAAAGASGLYQRCYGFAKAFGRAELGSTVTNRKVEATAGIEPA